MLYNMMYIIIITSKALVNFSFPSQYFWPSVFSHTHLIFVCVYGKRRLWHTHTANSWIRVYINRIPRKPSPRWHAHAWSPRSVCFCDNTPAGANYENYNAFAADFIKNTHTPYEPEAAARLYYIILPVCICVCDREHQRDARNSFNNIIYIYIYILYAWRLLCFIIRIKKCMWLAPCVLCVIQITKNRSSLRVHVGVRWLWERLEYYSSAVVFGSLAY